jgi:hypothetical protein
MLSFRARPTALIAVLLSLAAVPVSAQQGTALRGRAVDPEQRPVANAEVVLHRVGGAGGARLAVDTTDAAGNFELISAEAPDPAAVYFAATRRDGQLYVGEFVRAPLESAVPYELLVGGQPFSMDTPVPSDVTFGETAAAPGGPISRRFVLMLVPLLGLLGFAGWLLSRGVRSEFNRKLLLRVAVLDEEAGPNGLEPTRQRERDRLLERLLAD